MTTMERLMREAVDGVTPDVDALVEHAHLRGRALRRRRRAGVLGAAAGVAALAVGVALVLPDGGPRGGTDVATAPTAAPSAAPTSAVPTGPVRLTGRSTAALLRELVEDATDGTTTAYAGQGGGTGHPFAADTYAELDVTPPGEGVGVVGVNVQDLAILEGDSGACVVWMRDCASEQLPGGDVLRTYSDDPVPTAGGEGQRRVAELLSPRRELRVVAGATNGYDLPSNRWDLTRPDVVLDDVALRALVTDERWAFRIDATYAEAGEALSPYTDLDAGSEIEASSPPTQPEGGRPLSPTPSG